MKDDVGQPPRVAGYDGEAVRVIGGRADAGLVVVCDHASNALPPGYGTLGLQEADLRRHIAYDIGAEAVTLALARGLGVPAVLSRTSRLLIDPNRGADDPTLIMRLSDGAVIPGNRTLFESERERRIALYWRPYHEAIARTIDACIGAGVPPVIVSIHSFTPVLKGVPRPWHAGILWDKDPRLPEVLLAALSREADLVVGDNEPYTGKLIGDCMWQHGTQRGLAHAIIEIRQDLIGDGPRQDAWGARLTRLVGGLMADGDLRARLHRIEYFGSHTDPTGRLTAGVGSQTRSIAT